MCKRRHDLFEELSDLGAATAQSMKRRNGEGDDESEEVGRNLITREHEYPCGEVCTIGNYCRV